MVAEKLITSTNSVCIDRRIYVEVPFTSRNRDSSLAHAMEMGRDLVDAIMEAVVAQTLMMTSRLAGHNNNSRFIERR